ncbi:MAG TPA: amino acid adenylation domain-containing protein [Solirubrobacteraceae bacterium]|nr:amino acid adenylation domain-containing protein [Solirubrobacteraceae bacterium]
MGCVHEGVGGVLGLLQGWLGDERLAGARLVVVTRGAVAVEAGEAPRDLVGGGVWGLVRSAQAEHPGRFVLVDVDGEEASWEALLGALASGGRSAIDQQLAVRKGELFAPRLERVGARGELLLPGGDAAWRLDAGGSGRLEDLSVVSCPAAGEPLGVGQVRVEVRAAGLNFRDVLVALGVYPDAVTIGGEGAGVVREVGPGVEGLAVGDRVMGLLDGAFGSLALADQRLLVRVPEGWSFVRAAGVPIVFLTAYYALVDLGGVRAEERLLVHAAAGGVGMAAVQLARHLGMEVFGTASPGKWGVLEGLGLDGGHLASSRSLGFEEVFLRATGGRGVDVVLNSLTGEFVDVSLGLLGAGGRFLEMGKTDVRDPAVLAAGRPGVVYRAFDLMEAGPERIQEMLVELLGLFERGALEPLPTSGWDAPRAVEAFRFMSQGRHVGKNVLRMPSSAIDRTGTGGRGTVLVTGGTGGLGGLLARHLVVEHGVRHLLLVSRGGPQAQGAGELAQELADLGAEAVTATCDVADREQLRVLLEGIPADRPLRAVVHAAGVLDDGVIETLTGERLDGVLAPKVDGAWHLHELTAHMDLEAFVLFSSVAGTFGTAGQGNYASANAFLDALAELRQAQGLPAVSMAWGPWEQAGGMADRLASAQAARIARTGVQAFSPSRGLELFDVALTAGRARVLPVALDMALLRSRARAEELPTLLRGLVRAPARRAGAARVGGSLAHRVAGTSEAERERVVLEFVRGQVAAVLGHASVEAVPPGRPFGELGFDSLAGVELRSRLSAECGLRLAATLTFDYPTPAELSGFLLAELLDAPTSTPAVVRRAGAVDEPVAIIGMSCRYPGGVRSAEDMWELVASGRDAISGFPADRGWDLEGLYDPDPNSRGSTYARAGGFLYDAAEFDAGFFEINHKEALAMDPQQRLLLEVSWEALEAAGVDPHSLRGSQTGVFAGITSSQYGGGRGTGFEDLEGYRLTGHIGSVASGRVAYTLGLEGPAVSVDTACSSSLVALHLACGALRGGECSLALAGGVSVMATPELFVEFSRQRVLSPDGRCKAFANAADGTGWAEGVGVLLLERLSDARRNGHPVLALLRGSAVNQDGASNGLTAPNGPSQQRVIRQALASAGLSPHQVDAVEAHGTGTRLGDPIEAQALLATYGQERPADAPLWLGSIKSNIGHTVAAAGVAGVIKMVMALEREQLPRTLHVDEPTSEVDWDAGAVALLTEAVPWRPGARPRRAAVSAFGISGTNAHVILEEAPAGELLTPAARAAGRAGAVGELGLPAEDGDSLDGDRAVVDDRPCAGGSLLGAGALPWILSGKDEQALRAQAGGLRAHLQDRPRLGVADVGLSLAGRSALAHRAAVIGRGRDELVGGLCAVESGEPAGGVIAGMASVAGSGTVFLFAGQGSQWEGMATELLDSSELFAERLRACDEALGEHIEWSVEDVLRGAPGAPELERIDVVQPVLFAIMVSLAALWRACGVHPDVVVGHSQGELAAAHVAGGLGLEDAARVLALRSRALTRMVGKGGMVSVARGAAELGPLLQRFGDRLALAAVNGPSSVVVSGDPGALAELLEVCRAEGVRARSIPVELPGHSAGIEMIREELLEGCSAIAPRSGSVPFCSTVTGGWLDTAELDSAYWFRNLRQTVQFEQAIRTVLEGGYRTFIELSPHPVLAVGMTETAEDVLGDADAAAVVGSLRRHEGGPDRFSTSLAEAWVHGVEVDWGALFEGSGARRVGLPTYPFQRRRYWLASHERAADAAVAGQSSVEHPLLGAALELAGAEGAVFTGRLATESRPWLEDHVLMDTALFPGTGFLELALAAAGKLGLERLEELTLQAPLVLAQRGAVQLQLTLSEPDEQGRRRLEIYSRCEDPSGDGLDGREWTLHATGALGPAATPPDPELERFATAPWPPTGAEPLGTELLYDRLAEAGYCYGPAFQGLRAAWRRGEELFGEVGLGQDEASEAAAFHLHPALLDAALHPLLTRVCEGDGADALAVPFSFTGVRLYGQGATSLRVRLDTRADDVSLAALDPAGAAVVAIDSLATRPLDASTLRAAGSAGHDALFTVQWTTLPTASRNGTSLRPTVLGPCTGLQAPWADAPSFADVPALVEAIEDGALVPELVLTELRGEDARGDLAGAVHTRAAQALALLKAWLAAESLSGSQLVLLTHGAVAFGDESPDLVTAGLWGLVRSAQSEHPDRFRLLDVDDSEASLPSLAAALGSEATQLALREGALYAPRLARAGAQGPSGAPSFDPRGTVLITGGTGGLGGLVARHLAEAHGVGHLLLTSRRGPQAEGAAELRAELEALGAQVRIDACDVTDREQLRGLLDSVPAEHPLAAVVHAAGVLDDGVIAAQTAGRLRAVMAPKVDAALHLHELTEHLDLEAFVLFSSVAATIGSPGQGNYAAANAFLDALAAHRRALGLPGTSMAWGLWEQASAMTAGLSEADVTRMGRLGLGTLPTELGLGLFDAALGAGAALMLGVPLKLAALRAQARSGALPALFAGLVRLPGARPGEQRVSLARLLQTMPEAEHEGAVRGVVTAQLAAVLGHDASAALDGQLTFKQLGLDSLAALELRNRLTHASGLSLPATLVFDHPSVTELTQCLLSKLRQPTAPAAALPQLVSAPEARFDPFPLNDIQRAYLVGRSGAFPLGRVSTHFYCEAELPQLDSERLSTAIDRLIGRHDMLRAVFPADGRQRILETVAPYVVSVSDLSSASADAVSRHVAAVREQLSHEVRPADRWPLFELRVTRLPAGVALLHVSLDMLVMDLSSMQLLVAELTRLYREPDAELEPVGVTFRDYLLAERRVAESELFERSKAYWMERLPALPRAPELPLARSPAALERQVHVRREHRLDAERWARIKARAAAVGVTPAIAVMSAFAQVLAYWSKSCHFILNVTTSNRLPLDPRVEGIVGDFTTLEILEVDLREAQGLGQLATALQDRLWQDLEHCHFSGIQVIGELARIRDEGMVVAPIVFTSGLGVDGEVMDSVTYGVTQTPQVLLDHVVFEAAGSLLLSWDSVDDVFPAGMLDEMFGAYCRYLEAIAEQDGLWDGATDYDWLPAHQRSIRAQIRAESALPGHSAAEGGVAAHSALEGNAAVHSAAVHSAAEGSAAEGGLLHSGFLAQAALRPGQPALISATGQMTYAELAARAAGLARRLRACGVQPRSLVGVSVAKGCEQVVAVLGVLLAGGAYLPVDPELPDRRRHHLVEHAGAAVVVTEVVGSLGWPDGILQIAVDDGEEVVRDSALEQVQAASDLAYVLYTSGSTGAPKGVAITHRAAWNTIQDINDRFGVGPADRVLALSSLSFDLSVYDLFGVLAAGGSVVLPRAGATRDPRHWLELCETHGVTVWNSVPALMEMAVQQANAGPPLPAPMRLVLLSGDWIPVSLPDRIRALLPEAQVVSLGGATEAAIWSIFHPVGEVDPGWDSIPYGKPLRNQFWEVLNDRMEPCPVHVPGHLHIGGAGLAECYWQDREKTAASFIRHPRSGERLYRTGDLGRYLPDGNIEFLGREDSQVKIGGYRIELGEIEAHLNAHPRVEAAAVAAVGETRGHQRLAAYVVPRQEQVQAGDGAQLAPVAGGGNSQDKHAGLGLSVEVDMGAVIVDPTERLEFKLRRHGLRADAGPPAAELPIARGEQERQALHVHRKSHRNFEPEPVPLAALARLLEALGSVEAGGLPKYRYGSAGGLYPVQTYVAIRPDRVDGLAPGTYYYDPRAHALRAISPSSSLATDAHARANESVVAGSAFTIVLVAELAAIEPLYGDYAERFCLIEAGLMAHLLETEAAGCGIGLCQVAIGDGPIVRGDLELGDSQVVVHGLVGAVCHAQATENGNPRTVGRATLVDELRGWLAERLPDYMIPGQFVAIAELPLTANGKVDRNALRQLEQQPPNGAAARASVGDSSARGRGIERGPADAGQTAGTLGQRLQALPGAERPPVALDVVRTAVATILGLEAAHEIEPDVAFRELGFDSLQAVGLRNLLEAATGLELAATIIFDYPTARLLAGRVMDELVGVPTPAGGAADGGPGFTARPAPLSTAEGDPLDGELAEATADNIFELVDRELGRA